MKKLGGRLLRGAGRLGLWLLVPLFVIISIWATVMPSLNNVVGMPEVPPVDQATLDKAQATQGGELLTKTGYKAAIKISDEGIIKFLDEQEKKAGLSNPGPYVVFSLGKPKVQKAEDNGFTDPVVDVSNGAIVAISQEFIDSKGELDRGSICYNVKTIDILQGNWVLINEYLRGKSLNQQVPVTRELVPQLPAGFPDTPCYVYPAG